MAPPAGARCAKHPDASAVDVCQRCGTFVCGECVHIRAEDVYCADCARILDRPAPVRPKLAFALAAAPGPLLVALGLFAGGFARLLGLALFLPLAASALALILQERAARIRGQSPRKGAFYPLTWAMLAVDLLGVLGLLLFVVRRAADT
jgi:hypothetical protein